MPLKEVSKASANFHRASPVTAQPQGTTHLRSRPTRSPWRARVEKHVRVRLFTAIAMAVIRFTTKALCRLLWP